MLYPPKEDMWEVSKRNVFGGCKQTREAELHGDSKFFYKIKTTDLVVSSLFVIQEHQERWREVDDERM